MADAATRMNAYSGADNRENAFAAAARNSRRVRILRVVLLWGSLAAVALLIVIALFDPFRSLVGGFSMSGIGIDGTKVIMEHPKLAGFRKDGRAYTVNAQKAIQDARTPTLVELHEIDAEIGLANNGVAHVLAHFGLYDSSKEHMDVRDEVEVKSTEYNVTLNSASVDFKSNTFVSTEPVKVVAANGTTIDADAVSAVDNGHQLIFDGHVRSMIPPPADARETRGELKGTSP
jgi:lipopolysaccharide export system protein LptC